MRNFKVEKLEKGECIISREPGNSMTPILQSREPVILEPMTDWNKFKKKDIAYIKIHGKYYTHLVYAVDKDKGLEIGNNKGHIQGWTKKVFAKAHLIPKEWKDKAEEYLKIWIKENKNNDIKEEIKQEYCGNEFPYFGASYPDAKCIDGYLWDLDSYDNGKLYSGGDEPCPICNKEKFMKNNLEEWTEEDYQKYINTLKKYYNIRLLTNGNGEETKS